MKKLLILGILALGLCFAAPQAHSQIRVHVRARAPLVRPLVRPRVGFSVNVGSPGYYYQPQPYYGSTVIINHRDDWRRREWMRRHRFARMGQER